MIYLIVENGIITNCIEADEAFATSVGALPSYEGAKIGDLYNPYVTQQDRQASYDRDAMLVELAHKMTLLELGVK